WEQVECYQCLESLSANVTGWAMHPVCIRGQGSKSSFRRFPGLRIGNPSWQEPRLQGTLEGNRVTQKVTTGCCCDLSHDATIHSHKTEFVRGSQGSVTLSEQ